MGTGFRLADVSREAAEHGKRAVASALDTAIEASEVSAEEIPAILERIEPVADLGEAIIGTEIVVEVVTEDLTVKEKVWRSMGKTAVEEAVLVTNTSSYDINWFGDLVPHPRRVIGTHWFSPPPIVPCVEVIPGDATDDSITDCVVAVLERLGKEPARCRSVPGFVGNRIQMAMVAEAFRCLEDGVAGPAEIDRIVRGSFGLRLGAYGPFEIADLNGLDTYRAVYEYLRDNYGSDRFAPPAALVDYCEQGRHGVKSGEGVYPYTPEEAERTRAERDRRLYAQLRALRRS